ncbi:MAG: hypothetical protein JWM39_258 [Parcubacteria group bacterium]|nr:hypothetical protein [Parcubacteria group bacterium]
MVWTKRIQQPEKSIELAEFIGIMIGDGNISKYQVKISLHHTNDLEYSRYVSNLIQKLFAIEPHIQKRPTRSVNDLVISRIELVRFLHSAGLPKGNKTHSQIDIPCWIKENPKFLIACIRGLVDTDGCVFDHSYISKGKRYTYKKLDFSSASEPLRKTVYTFFKELGMCPRFSSRNGVRLESKADLKAYFRVISSHNPKHLNRYAT